MSGHPAIDPAPIVADLESRSLNRFDQMKIFTPLDLAGDDVTHLQVIGRDRSHGTELAGLNFA